MVLNFPMGAEKAFSRFYDHTRRFNKELTKSFLAYNKIIDQNRLNRYSISVSKNGERIQVRLPLETNAIKLLVWSYYKNYLDSTIEDPKADYRKLVFGMGTYRGPTGKKKGGSMEGL